MEASAAVKVTLDAGHGASRGRSFTGACANGLAEDDVVLDLVQRVGHHLRKAGHETVYTRSDDILVPLIIRAKLARAAGCDLFLSIHCNAGPPSASGIEAFVVENDLRSKRIGLKLVKALSSRGLTNRGVKWDTQSQHPRLSVLRNTYRYMSAVLLEVGFLTSKHDSLLLKNRFFCEDIAKVIVDQIIA